MKILIVHNSYGRYSGEEAVVDKTAALFRELGHDVCFYRRTTEGVRGTIAGNLSGFINGIYSPSGVKEMRETLQREQPDLVNIHNLYPFISPAALFECRKAGIPVYMTVHNYRLICPTGLFMRNGQPCELCLERGNEWSCIYHNCEHSITKSLGYAIRNTAARWSDSYKKCVNRFVCITDFQRQKLTEAGYNTERISVIPNSIDAPASYTPNDGSYIAYLGRLSYEKGYDLLLEVARRHPEIPFRMAGAIRENVHDEIPDNVEHVGYVTGQALQDFIQKCRFIVMPSRCYEGFPMAILEGAQYGKPTIGPRHGGFTEIIGEGNAAIGRLFRPGDISDLEKNVIELWTNIDECRQLGQNAFGKLNQQYSTEIISQHWEELLQDGNIL